MKSRKEYAQVAPGSFKALCGLKHYGTAHNGSYGNAANVGNLSK